MFNQANPIVVIDTETAGLQDSAEIIQLAAIAINPKTFTELASLESKWQFDVTKADKATLAVNHYTEEAWKSAIPASKGLQDFSRFLDLYRCAKRISKANKPYAVAIGAGWNSKFDSDKLFFQSRRFGTFLGIDPRFLDVMQLAMWKQLPCESYKLTSVAKHFGLDTEGAHDALADVRLTIRVLQKLLEA